MFASEKWGKSNFAKSEAGKNIESIIFDNVGFWRSVSTCLTAAIPLIRVLRQVDSETPATGFIFEAMVSAKKDIKYECKNVKARYQPVHSKRRNRLQQQKMNDLVYVMYNLKLSGREERKQKEAYYAMEQLETVNFEDVDSDDEWITEDNEDLLNMHENDPTVYGGSGDYDFLEQALRNQHGDNGEFGEEAHHEFEEGNEVNAPFEVID
ncbi:hypothetical protein CTI12_AA092450 [Artemisia annua]|uniref:Uncharacterized protein n=1 Tax=Artemisia annua TaxID=35608 RepID=A0A2U1PZA1_ARTAN|nr:hypothetical protein CTI12_AA092450 [Artemisia annua]